MLKVRIITAAVLICILLAGLLLLPPLGAVVAFGVVFAVGAWEWGGFGSLSNAGVRVGFVLLISLLMLGGWYWTRDSRHLQWVLLAATVWWFVALVWLAAVPGWHRPALILMCGIPTLVPAFLALGSILTLRRGFAGGAATLLCMVALVCAADIGAYFAGRHFGRHKLAPRVSPGKTWEGVLGGLLLVALVGATGAGAFHLPLAQTVAFACLVGIFSVVGDLTESLFKRAAGLKDSGTLLPGHGGLLDRMDSVTAAAPLYALGLFGSGVIA